MSKRYPTFDDINPDWYRWQPLRFRNDPDPNPAFMIGQPKQQTPMDVLFRHYKINRSIEEFMKYTGRGR